MTYDIVNYLSMDSRIFLRGIHGRNYSRLLTKTTPKEEAFRKAKRKATKQARKRNRR